MNIPFADIKKQYHSIKMEIDSAITEVLNDTAFIRFNQSAGSAQTDINTDARFMGYLLG